MTNADKIKSMSNEQLAKFLKNYHMEDICESLCEKSNDCTNYCDYCVTILLSWLEAEARNERTDCM